MCCAYSLLPLQSSHPLPNASLLNQSVEALLSPGSSLTQLGQAMHEGPMPPERSISPSRLQPRHAEEARSPPMEMQQRGQQTQYQQQQQYQQHQEGQQQAGLGRSFGLFIERQQRFLQAKECRLAAKQEEQQLDNQRPKVCDSGPAWHHRQRFLLRHLPSPH
jgi:hypothetical protein